MALYKCVYYYYYYYYYYIVKFGPANSVKTKCELLTINVIIKAGNKHQIYTSIIITNSISGMDLYSMPITVWLQ